MPWITRGLRNGIVTSRYPHRSDDYGETFHAAVGFRDVSLESSSLPRDVPEEQGEIGLKDVAEKRRDDQGLARLCPTGAIEENPIPTLDRGRCVLCGNCVRARPDLFEFLPDPAVAELESRALTTGLLATEDDGAVLDRVRSDLSGRVKALRRSVHIRHVDAGSDGSEESEIAALLNPIYDVQRLGIFFTASPRHADLLLVTGVGSAGMAGPLARTYEAMPNPKIVIAAGSDALKGGIVHPTYATGGGVGSLVPVDVWIPGSPPSPFSLLHGILLGLGLLEVTGARR